MSLQNCYVRPNSKEARNRLKDNTPATLAKNCSGHLVLPVWEADHWDALRMAHAISLDNTSSLQFQYLKKGFLIAGEATHLAKENA